MTFDLSVVVPVHNEEKYLPFVLPALVRLYAGEFVFVLDNCVDNSEQIIHDFFKLYKYEYRIHKIDGYEGCEFNFRVAFVKFICLCVTWYDNVLLVDADTIVDYDKINYWVDMLDTYKMICFDKVDVPVNFRWEIRKPFTFWMSKKATPIMLFDKWYLLDGIDFDVLCSIRTGVDFYFHDVVKRRFPVKFVGARNLHLRPKTTSSRRFSYGRNSYKFLHRSFFRILVSCLMSLDLVYLKGYLVERFGN